MSEYTEAGYTKDIKFIAQRNTVGFVKGEILWLSRDDGTRCPSFTNGTIEGFMYLPLANTSADFLDLKVYVEEKTSYQNPPHKHADVIIEWAKGAEIECLSGNKWYPVCNPDFYNSTQYRVKPIRPQKQLEKEALQEQLAKIEQETAILKQKISRLGE
jgi:hypothetical protein